MPRAKKVKAKPKKALAETISIYRQKKYGGGFTKHEKKQFEKSIYGK